MKHEDSNNPSALEEVVPVMVAEWKRRAAISPAWSDYALLLHAFAEALRRAPFTAEACEKIDPVACLNTELACLSDVLLFLFPDGKMQDKSYKTASFFRTEREHP